MTNALLMECALARLGSRSLAEAVAQAGFDVPPERCEPEPPPPPPVLSEGDLAEVRAEAMNAALHAIDARTGRRGTIAFDRVEDGRKSSDPRLWALAARRAT